MKRSIIISVFLYCQDIWEIHNNRHIRVDSYPESSLQTPISLFCKSRTEKNKSSIIISVFLFCQEIHNNRHIRIDDFLNAKISRGFLIMTIKNIC